MFVPMKAFLVAAVLLVGCRPADGGSQNPPAAGRDTPRAASDSTINALLERADAGRSQGSRGALVWLVEISDFQCPFCKRWHDEIYPAIQRDYIAKGLVRMAYLNMPLGQHQHAVPAAEAALCAAAQDRFWPMHDRLFDTQERWTPMADARAYFDSLALASGVNAVAYRSCMSSGVMRRVINGDRSRVATSGANSTPTFFVGDAMIRGVAPLDSFRLAIERARAKAVQRTP